MITDRSILHAALIGYEDRIAQARAAVTELKRQLGVSGKETNVVKTISVRRQRTLSPAARKRIADAQKKRWAEYKRQKAAA